jgi:hypothetical protein
VLYWSDQINYESMTTSDNVPELSRLHFLSVSGIGN